MLRLQLSFHNTFALKRKELATILRAAAEAPLSDNLPAQMSRTGFGNKKIGPVKSWASRAGLLRNGKLTAEGDLVYQHDPHLTRLETAWFMHFNLAFGEHGLERPPVAPETWGGWPYFVFNFRPTALEFTEDELVSAASAIFEGTREQLKSNLRHVLRAYTSDEALAACRFLECNESGIYRSGEPQLPHPMMLGYILSRVWQRDFGDTASLVTEAMAKQHMGLAPLLGGSPSSLQETLDKLEGLAIVEQRRTVAPFQTVRRWTSSTDLLRQAYVSFS